jgi:cystathionine beta-lyase/cystathionine gamma-synthase
MSNYKFETIGTEHIDDIIADLDQGLKRAQ